jgi:hypothetical protein
MDDPCADNAMQRSMAIALCDRAIKILTNGLVLLF